MSHYGVTPQTPHGYGHVGVALATSIVALVNFFALAIIMRGRIKRLNGREIVASFLKIAAASAVLSVVCYFSHRLLLDRLGLVSVVVKLLEVLVPIGLGGVAFVIVAKLLRIKELEQAFGAVMRKFVR